MYKTKFGLKDRLDFGCNNGRTILEVLTTDRNYLKWLDENNPTLFSALCKKYINNILPLPDVYN